MKATTAISLLGSFLKARLLGRRIPLVASIIPTNRCNLRCAYCGRWERPGPELSTEKWLELVDELADLGCLRVSITGGEPLLFKGFADIVRQAKKRDLFVSVNTNGVLVPRFEDKLAPVDSVTISLDGPREIHDALRGEGTYDDVCEAAGVISKSGKALNFYTVLSRANMPHLSHVLELAKKYNGHAFFQPGTYYDFDGLKKNPEAPEVAQFRQGIDWLINRKKNGAPMGNSVAGLRYLRNWPGDAPLRCFGGLMFLRIEADGSLRFCGRDGGGMGLDVTSGIAPAMNRLPAVTCASCWSAARVEFNLLAAGNPSAIITFLRS